MEYFINHLGNKKPEISNIKHGYEVVKTLAISQQILS